MTNAQIIFAKRLELMEAGVIGTTGRKIRIKDEDGSERVMWEPAQIHTFQAWKELGYCVKKGEHAKAKFTIWKYSAGKKTADEADGEEQDHGHMFMKTAFFFSAGQVEPLQKKEAAV